MARHSLPEGPPERKDRASLWRTPVTRRSTDVGPRRSHITVVFLRTSRARRNSARGCFWVSDGQTGGWMDG